MKAWSLSDFRRTPAGKRNSEVLDNAYKKDGKVKASTRHARDRVRKDKGVSGEIHDEEKFFEMLAERGIPKPKSEWSFSHRLNALGHPEKFRADYFFLDAGLILEVHGGIFMMGGHSGGKGQLDDMRKMNVAAMQGYRMMACTPQQLCTEELVDMVVEAYHGGGDMPLYHTPCDCE